MPALTEHLTALPDPCMERTRDYLLLGLLAIALCVSVGSRRLRRRRQLQAHQGELAAGLHPEPGYSQATFQAEADEAIGPALAAGTFRVGTPRRSARGWRTSHAAR